MTGGQEMLVEPAHGATRDASDDAGHTARDGAGTGESPTVRPLDTGEGRDATGEGAVEVPTSLVPAGTRSVPDDGTVERLREYLVRGLGSPSPRPRDGTSIQVTLTPADVKRTRRTLRSFARRPGVYEPLAIAATSLDVALQDLQEFARTSQEAVSVSLDRWDCALVGFAVAEALGRDSDDGDLTLDHPGGRGADRPDLR